MQDFDTNVNMHQPSLRNNMKYMHEVKPSGTETEIFA